uniref:Uncharacterized protein n=1 Tax=Rhizophora mucronata TaxID=61149 RepID=A0A2P2QXM2_RHIMU
MQPNKVLSWKRSNTNSIMTETNSNQFLHLNSHQEPTQRLTKAMLLDDYIHQ